MSDAPRPDPYRALRDQIDRIDARLLELLNERARVALQIGRLKRANNEPIYVPERERAVLERVAQSNGGPLSDAAVQAVFESIIAEIRALETGEREG
jgi:chorismate mutase/prephenate dehydratase